MKTRTFLFSMILTALALAGCSTAAVNPPGEQDLPAPVAQVQTFTPSPSATWTVTPSPSATATQTPTPTATPHPLTIEAMRQGQYPGSEIVFEQRLDPGANYSRHLVSYQSEGLKIYALMTIPNGEPPPGGWPVIVFNHGYIPPSQYRPTERYIAYVNGFAVHGYIVLRPDYRGHGDSEGVARGAYSTPDYTIDVLNAVASIQRYPQANPEKIGMWGHSMGGHITLRSMVTTGDIKAGVIWAGVVGSYPDMIYRWRPTAIPTLSSQTRRFSRALVEDYGTPDENPAFWDTISPITYVADLSGPIQLHHATGDSVVPVHFSQSLYDAAVAAGMEAEYYVYPGDDHNIANSFSAAMQRSIEFFDRYLK